MWKGKSTIQMRAQEKIVCNLAVMQGSISSFASALLNSRLLSSKEYCLSRFRHVFESMSS